MTLQLAAPATPFKGLSPFDDSELDALLFFGREREREVVIANLMASRLTVLFGPSGVGKTSLLRAGVAQWLHLEPDTAVQFVDSWSGEAVEAVRSALAARPEGGDLYLVLDQFEEYFLYHAEDVELPALLADLIADRGLRVNILIGIRDDALALLDTFRRPIPSLLANRLRLDRLDRAAARAAILGPIERYKELSGEHVEIEPALIEAVLEEVASGRVDLGRAGRGGVDAREDVAGIEAPYLQLVLERLWEAERQAGSGRLRLETLQRLGGAARIVRDHLEHAMTALTPPEKEAAAAMYDHLVTPSGTKIAHRIGDLAGYASVSEPEAARVLSKLVQERILRASSQNGPAATRYEIFHDVLADAVLAWRSRHDEQRALRVAEARRRRAHRVAAAALAALVVVAAIAVFALVERSSARSEARHARAEELAARAVTALDVDPARSVALAYDAARLDPGRHQLDVLRSALTADRLRDTLLAGRPIAVAAFAPSGRRLLTAGADGHARIYGVGATRPEFLLDHGAPITATAFSGDGGRVATGGEDGRVAVWDTHTGQRLRTLRVDGTVATVTYAGRDRLLVAASHSGRIHAWRTRDGRPVASFRARTRGGLVRVVVSANGRRLVAVTRDRHAGLYALPGGRPLRRLVQAGFIEDAAFSPDGQVVATSGYNGQLGGVRLWRAADGRFVRDLVGAQRHVVGVTFSDDGALVAAASTDGTARVWNRANGEQVAIMLGHLGPVTSVDFNREGTALVTTSTDGTARVWATPAAGGRLVAVLAGHRSPVSAAAFNRSGRRVVTVGGDGTARLWDPATEPELTVRARLPAAISGLAVSSAGGRLLVGDAAGTLRVVSAPGIRLIRRLQARRPVTDVAFGATGPVAAVAPQRAVAFTTDFELEATASGDSVSIGSPGARPVRTLHPHGGPVLDLSFSPDGRTLGIGTTRGAAQLWEVHRGRRTHVLRGHIGPVNAIAFSPDGHLVVTAGADHDARLWDAESGSLVRRLPGHFGPVVDARFSPDGEWIVTAGPTTAGIWRTVGQEPPGLLRATVKKTLSAAAFAGTGGHLVVATGRDGTLSTYTCDICGGADTLLALARARLAR